MEIAATSKALHDVKKLLNTANKSMALTEVIDSKVCEFDENFKLKIFSFHRLHRSI